MKKSFWFQLVIFLAIVFIGAGAFADTTASPDKVLGFTYNKLKNGMELYTRKMERSPLTAVYIFFKGGFKDEPGEHKGIAHLVEHLIFRGTEKYSAEEIYKLERNGGFFNGGTTFDYTTYYMLAPENEVDKATEILMDMVFNPAMRDADIELEKKIVLAEDQERQADQTAFYSLNLFYDFILRHDREGIISLKKDDLKRFHAQIYRPENAVVVIAGKFDEKKQIELLENWTKPAAPEGKGIEQEISDKSGQKIIKEIALKHGSYQILMGYELGELTGKELIIAKLIPYLISYEGIKLDYLHNYDDITYDVSLDRIGNKYYFLIYYENSREIYNDEIGEKHKNGMLKIINRLGKKDFSREYKKIFDRLNEIKSFKDYSATYAADILMTYLYSTYLSVEDIESIGNITMKDINDFAAKKLSFQPYAWIVVKNKPANSAKEPNK